MDSFDVIIIIGGIVVEIILLLRYKVLHNKFKSLNGTGRIRDIEITLSYMKFVKLLLAFVPLLLVLSLTDILKFVI
jgi:hypothetical protein